MNEDMNDTTSSEESIHQAAAPTTYAVHQQLIQHDLSNNIQIRCLAMENKQYNIDHIFIAHKVIQSGVPNRFGCRFPIHTNWNLPLMQSLLSDYDDQEVVEWLQFGFPISRDPEAPQPIPNDCNHKGATAYPDVIDNYIVSEMKNKATLGPFILPPFLHNIGISPLSTREKKDSKDRRIIMDLSFYEMGSVNWYIDKNKYLGHDIKLTYPTIDQLARRVYELGEHCLLYKRDLSRYFRQIPACPGSYSFLGWRWKQMLFFDRMMPMGLVSSSYVAQRITNAITYIHRNAGFFALNYLDDFGSAEHENMAWRSYMALERLLENLGVDESKKKAQPPSTRMEFLGTTLDSTTMTMEVSPNRLLELTELIDMWLMKENFNRKQLEKLIGKLQFVTNCVRSGRIFISRLINTLSGLREKTLYPITEEIQKDLQWWKHFLPKYNGISIIWLEKPTWNQLLATDASLTGLRGICDNEYFRTSVPEDINWKFTNIAQLEILAVVIAVKVWEEKLHGKFLCIKSDNQSVVSCLNFGRAKDRIMQECLRTIAMIGAVKQFTVRTVYIKSKNNKIPDLLSRHYQDRRARQEFRSLRQRLSLKRKMVTQHMFNTSEF